MFSQTSVTSSVEMEFASRAIFSRLNNSARLNIHFFVVRKKNGEHERASSVKKVYKFSFHYTPNSCAVKNKNLIDV